MPRPQRIEFENAFYHVMNRGRASQAIFHGEAYYKAFIDCLAEAHQQFDSVLHSYCLLGNQYHLLIETPNANLARIMRHINGVYTQRHNRLKETDGPLFRGRYKAILVDADNYLLPLSCYVHRHPIDIKRPLVKQLEDYPWSSYRAYIGLDKSPSWLEREVTYNMLGKRQKYVGYKAYVNQGVGEDIQRLYNRGNHPSVIADDAFRQWLYEEQLPELTKVQRVRAIRSDITIQEIVEKTAKFYHEEVMSLRKIIKGPNQGLEARKVAMYLSQKLADCRLQEIADYFQLSHAGSASFAIHQVKQYKLTDKKFAKRLELLMSSIIGK